MDASKLQLQVDLLLPGVESETDQCIDRVREQLQKQKGIREAHLTREADRNLLCLHFDPDLVSLEQVRRIAEQAGARVAKQYQHETLKIAGMDCADCALSIEHVLRRRPGILHVAVNYATERMGVEYDTTRITHEVIVRQLEAMGYRVDEARAPSWLRRNWELVLAILSGVFLAAGFFGERFLGLPRGGAIALYLIAYLCGGFDTARHGISAALKLRFDIDFLMVVAAIGAAALGEWEDGALLLFLFSIGHSLEHLAMDRARHSIEALGEITPKTARVRRDGQELELPVEQLARGDLVISRNGERLPVDGVIRKGQSAVDQSPVTGESVPVEKGVGDQVFAGTINGEGALEVEVTRLAQDTTLARVVKMVQEAQTQKSPTQRLTERFTRIFVPAVLVTTGLLIVVPPMVGWLSWPVAFLRAMTLLVACSPCALALATPSAVLAGIARAARDGVLIKGGVHLENLGKLKAIALDKTGTLTHGKPEVTDVVTFQGRPEPELLRVAATVESRSSHPLAQAIVRRAQKDGLVFSPAGEVQTVSGKGLRANVEGEEVLIGNMKLFREGSTPIPAEVLARADALEGEGKTIALIQIGGRFAGVIALADQPREVAASTMQALRRSGVETLLMLTGDNERVAAAVAAQVGVTEFQASLLPEQKVAAIRKLLEDKKDVAMVGDGVNDAPALAAATVGIAMGAGGTDVALETADVALMSDDIAKLPLAVALGRQSRRVIWQNLVISVGVIALLAPLALFGVAGIGPAIIAHEGSTLVVVANALRLLGFRGAAQSTG